MTTAATQALQLPVQTTQVFGNLLAKDSAGQAERRLVYMVDPYGQVILSRKVLAQRFDLITERDDDGIVRVKEGGRVVGYRLPKDEKTYIKCYRYPFQLSDEFIKRHNLTVVEESAQLDLRTQKWDCYRHVYAIGGRHVCNAGALVDGESMTAAKVVFLGVEVMSSLFVRLKLANTGEEVFVGGNDPQKFAIHFCELTMEGESNEARRLAEALLRRVSHHDYGYLKDVAGQKLVCVDKLGLTKYDWQPAYVWEIKRGIADHCPHFPLPQPSLSYCINVK